MIWYIIEHPTRGVFTGLGFDVVTGAPKPHFSHSASRNDERVEKVFNAARVAQLIGKFPDKLQRECYVLKVEKEYGERNAKYTEVPLTGDGSLPVRA